MLFRSTRQGGRRTGSVGGGGPHMGSHGSVLLGESRWHATGAQLAKSRLLARGGGHEVGSRWANGEGGGTVSVWVSGLGGTYRTLSMDVWKAAGTRPTAGGRRIGRWANGEGGGTVSVWVSGLGGTYLERGRVEGSRDVSHSGWTAAWQVGKRRGQGHGQEGGDVSH